MDATFFITLAFTIIFGTLTIYLTLKYSKRVKLVWGYRTRHIIGLEDEVPSELSSVLGRKVANDVYKTKAVFLNTGNGVVNASDVVESIKIRFNGGEILKEPDIIAMSKNPIGFRVSKVSGDSAVTLSFKYLGRKDGAVIEVLHTKVEAISCSGDIKNEKINQREPLSPTEREPPTSRISIGVVLGMLAHLGLMWSIIGLKLSGLKTAPPGAYWATFGVSSILTIYYGIALYFWIQTFFLYGTFPPWSRIK